MVDGKPLTKQHIMLQRFKHTIALVEGDINGDKRLDYGGLLSEMKTRLGHVQLSEWLSSVHEDLEGLDKLAAAIDTPGFHIVSDLFSFLSNMLRLVGLRRTGRPVTTGEKIITGLCLASIFLIVTSFVLGLGVTGLSFATLGFVLTGMVIGRAVISLVKFRQTIREKHVELDNRKQAALHSKEKALQLLTELSEPHSKNETDKQQQLRIALDKYIVEGYSIHHLRAGIEHRRNKIMHRIHFTMKVLVITGAILLLFVPFVGALVIGAAGLIATVTLIVGWIHRRYELKNHALKDITAIPDEEAPSTMDSTAIEMLKLNSHSRSAEFTEEVGAEELKNSPAFNNSVPIAYSKNNNIHDDENINTSKKL